ncbi:MAG: adenosylcobinamide amidohydrolase [Chloroflexi bacterium]|nr:adenosylcobinamide amidohydrolase [Chloroflexota bacterium]
MNIPIHGISITQTPEVIHVRSVSPLNVLSSAIVGGGFRRASHILNAHVDKDYNSTNSKADLRALARSCGIENSFVGLLTAVYLRKARLTFFEEDGLSVGALITAGVGNAASAGITQPYRPRAGTINIILLLDANLSRSAMLNAFITATEAKTAVIQSRNIRTPAGDLATGTSTDTVTIATTGKGKLQNYAGSVTVLGWLIARAVRQALSESLDAG